jgi:hypothetical protein
MTGRLVRAAHVIGLINKPVEAAIDATGLDSQHRSHYFTLKAGERVRYRHFVKMTIVCDTESQFILAAAVCRGPGNDSPLLPRCMRKAASRTKIGRLLADCGYDSEAHHALCRERLCIPETLIAVAPRNSKGKVCSPYRSRMKDEMAQSGRFGQRWQVESGISRFKRRLTSCLGARKFKNQKSEVLLMVLTYNLMIVSLSILFICLSRLSENMFSTEQFQVSSLEHQPLIPHPQSLIPKL